MPMLNDNKDTIKVCIKPTVIGKSKSSTISPINIICKLQNTAPITTNKSPNLTDAS